MSLLLDALNRASKEKQKAAAAAAQAEAPAASPPAPETGSISLASTPTEALKWEKIPHPTPDPLPAAPAESQRPAPPVLITPVQPDLEMELTLVDAPPEAVAPAPKTRFEPRPSPELPPPPEIPPLVAPPTELPSPPTLAPANSTPREPTLEAPPPLPAAPAPPAPPPPMPPVLAPAPPPQPPAPAPALVPPAAPAPASAPALRLDVAPTAKSVPDGQKAQDIRRAYEGPPSDTRKGRRRAMALGGLAVGLALAFGSVFLGLWGDPAQWLGGPGVSTVSPPPPVGIQEPAAPAQAALPAEPAASGVVAPVQAPAALAQANAIAPRPAPATAAVSGPSPAVPSAKSVDIAKGGLSGKASPAAPGITPQASRGAAPRPPAAAPAPVLSAQTPVASPAASPTPSPVASPAATGNEVVLRANNQANPNFVAKTRGPSALEQGYALLLEGRLDDAAAAYSQALRANTDERDALLGMAYISQKKGQREDAQTYYRRVLRQDPNNARALAGLQALDSGSDTTLTASRAGDLASRQPDSAAAMAMAGNAFVRDGLLSNAVQAYARAQTLEPSNPLHAYNHAVALDRLGRYAAAVVQYERVLALSTSAPVAERAYQIDDVRLRLAQLRQALAPTESAAP